MAKENNSKQLYRSEKNRVIAGVCGGIGEYYNFDPNILRIILVVLSILGGAGVLLYLVIWLIVPSASSKKVGDSQLKENAQEMKLKAKKLAGTNPKIWFGLLLLVFGFAFLFSNFGFIHIGFILKFWPLAIIILALSILTSDERK
jgi:phage shock protein C